MKTSICLACARVLGRTRGPLCPTCGGRLSSVGQANVQALVAVLLQRELDARGLERDAPPEPTPERTTPHQPIALAPFVPYGERSTLTMSEPAPPIEPAEDAPPSEPHLFRRTEVMPYHPELEAVAPLVELDPPSGPSRWETEFRPLLYENIGWFIGTLLVLAGSVYGVREAWRVLGGVARHGAVAGALFAYHAGFTGLAALMARRSETTGKVLSLISLGLLPVVYVALAAMVDTDPTMGLALSAPFVLGTLWTVRAAERRLGAEGLLLAFVPCLLAELLAGASTPTSPMRLVGPLVGVAALGLAALRSGTTFGLTAYAAGALGVLAYVGGPQDPARGPLAAVGFPFLLVAACAATTVFARRPALESVHPRTSTALTVAALAGTLLPLPSVLSALPRVGTPAAFGPPLAIATAVASFLWVSRSGWWPALHVGGLLAPLLGALIGQVLGRDDTSLVLGAAGGAAGSWALARLFERGSILVGWGNVGACLALIAALVLDRSRGAAYPATLATGALLAVTGHLLGGGRHRSVHYFAALGVLALVLARVDPAGPWTAHALAGVAIAYGVAGALVDLLVERHDLAPLEDLSLAALIAAAGVALLRTPQAPSFNLAPHTFSPGGFSPPVLVIGGLFFVRAIRDRSRVVAGAGATLLVLAYLLAAGPRAVGQFAVTLAAAALGAAIVASIRGTHEVDELEPRRLFGAIELPLAAVGRRLHGDGFALASLLASTGAVLASLAWLSARVETERVHVVHAGLLLVATQLVAFSTPAFAGVALRGSIASLSLTGVLVALTAVENRIGRPLPPSVVAFRLPLIGAAVWGFALGLRWIGPRLGRALDAEDDGPRYHLVPHVGVGALAALLAVDAVIVGAPARAPMALSLVPPLMPIGAALLVTLLGISARGTAATVALRHLVLALLAVGAALLGAQRDLLARATVVLPPIELVSRATFGVAVLACACAALGALERRRRDDAWLAAWTMLLGLLLLFTAFFHATRPSAALLGVAGAILAVLGPRRMGAITLAMAGLLALHGHALAQPALPATIGPLVAASAAVAAVAVHGLFGALAAAAVRAFGALLAFAYALGSGRALTPLAAVSSLLDADADQLAGGFLSSPAVGLTALVVAGAYLSPALRDDSDGAHQQPDDEQLAHPSAFATAIAAVAAGLGAVTLGAFHVVSEAGVDRLTRLLAESGSVVALVSREGGPRVALPVFLCAAIFHGLSQGRGDRPRTEGARLGRDFLLLLAFVVAAVSPLTTRLPLRSLGPVLPHALEVAGLGLVVALAVSVHAAFTERTGRHVYYAQACLVMGYQIVRSTAARGASPEVDATFALGLGFLLVAVTVQARRAKIPEVAAATRTFAALLPLLLFVVLPGQATTHAAGFALASGSLYGALAWVERSRLLGSLGAIAVNVALLLLAVSHGLDGTEMYVAALGCTVLALGHVFGTVMPQEARNTVRTIGGLLALAPPATRLAVDLGTSPNSAFAVGFGAACLLSVLLGMVLHIRAYLALGTGFLVLDVIANLTAAGLRDHRIGFVVLSLSGLAILGGMAFLTVQRERVQSWARALRVLLRGWD